ncbi:carbohydrate-binding protein [Falsihalocynthiibacter sp. SS001]|uniref:carbohydrate-binding protein n=1 Tax=Falsihalocynthiibacter sp. SS001 TaxID=3349698 RepID=UPI0036D35E8C
MAFDTVYFEGEVLELTAATFGTSLQRTQTENQEKAGINNPDGATNSGLPDFDEWGLRPNYSGDGYLDLNGPAETKAVLSINGPGEVIVPAGTYELTVRGAANNNRSIEILVDGVAQGGPTAFNTTEFYNWETQTFTLTIPEGASEIQIAQTSSAGPNIDAIALHEVGAAVTFHAPEISSSDSFSIAENSNEVGDVVATDVEDVSGTPSTLTYSVSGADAAFFEIDQTGTLSFIGEPDYENPQGSNGNEYLLTVEVSDGVLTTTQDVTVTVTDVDPELPKPTIDAIIVQAEEGVISAAAVDPTTLAQTQLASTENAGTGKDQYNLWNDYSDTGYLDFNGDGSGIGGDQSVAYSVTVTEAGLYDLHFKFMNNTSNRPIDVGVNGVVQHSQLSFVGTGFGNWIERAPVQIELQAGENIIELAVPAGFNNGPNFDAFAITTSGDPAPEYGVPNTAPTFDGETLAVDVAEGATDVVNLNVTDDGQGTVSFELGGADAELFTIDAAGALSFIEAPDYESPSDDGEDNIYNVSVTVSDEAGSDTIDVTVTATDVVEDVLPSAITLAAVPVDENVAGAVVATVTVVDPDTTYTAEDLTLNDPSGMFELITTDGVIVKLKDGVSLDFEASAQPEISVSLGGLTSESFTPSPNDVDEGPVQASFLGAITSYSSQDKPATGDATPSEDGSEITLEGNLWKRVALDEALVINDGSRMIVDIQIGALEPELVLIGFDDDDSPFESGDNSVFQLAGTQDGPSVFADLRGTGSDQGDGVLRFEIDLSGLAGRSFDSIVIAADDDNASDGYGSVTFSNVIFDEQPTGGGDNSAPRTVGGGISDISVDEGGALEIDLPFVDDDGDTISYAFEVRNAGNELVIVPGLAIADGVLSGDVPEAPGEYTITITADDGNGGIGTDSFDLTVVDVNDAPIAEDAAFEPFFSKVGEEIAGIDISQFASAFNDPDGDPLELVVEGLPNGLEVNSEGVISGTATEEGSGSFTIFARDPDGAVSGPITIGLIIEAPQLGDVTVIEAENFTGLAEAENFYAAAQPGASNDQLIRVNNSEDGSVSTQLSAHGLATGYYQVTIDVYDETDGTATFSLQVGDTLLADGDTFDALGEFKGDGVSNRGNAGQSGNQKTISFDTVVYVDSDTVLTLSGSADGELLRTDRLTFTRVEQPNALPENIALANSSVDENTYGAEVGVLSATDPDGDDSAIIFSVDESSPFEVVDGTLKLKGDARLDFETSETVSVDVTATDADGGGTVTTLNISIIDMDEPPASISLDNTSVDENAEGAIIGTLGAVDPEGGAITFEVSDDRFVVEGTTLRLADGVALDAEDPAAVSVTVSASDGVNVTEQSYDITVNDLNDAPELAAEAALDDVEVPFASEERIALSGLGATDQDAGDTVAYLAQSTGIDPLPAGIFIDGDELVVDGTVPTGTYEIEVSATDGSASSAAVAFTLTVGDPAPFAPIVIQPDDSIITLSDTPDGDATITFHRDENVAEDAETPGTGKILENGLRAGYSGTGYVDFGDDPGDTATFTFNVPEAGSYDLNIRYASQDAGGNPRELDVGINGVETNTIFPSTGPGDGPAEQQGFNTWMFLTTTVTLVAGENTVTLAMADGTNAGPNVDRIEITEAGSGPIPEDTTADEGDDLAATGPAEEVSADDNDAVDFTLSGLDADITLIEVSINGGATFEEVTPADDVVTLDLSGLDAGTQTITFRVTDGVGNTAETDVQVDLGGDTPTEFSETIQLADGDPRVVIIDEDRDGGGAGNVDMTQIRDSENPEPDGAGKIDGLWPGFNGNGYLDMGGDIGDAFSFAVTVPEDGNYLIDFRFNQGSGSTPERPMTLEVDGVVLATLTFPSNGDWTIWQNESAVVALSAGENVITMTNTIANGPNFDQVTVTRDGVDTSADADEFPLDLSGDTGELSGAQAASINFNVSGMDDDIVKVELSFDGGTTRTDVTDVVDADGDFTFDGSSLPAGQQVATIIVTDDAGNEASDTLGFSIAAPAFEATTLQAEDALITDVGDPGTGPEGRSVTREVNAENPDAFGNYREGGVGDAYLDFGENPGDAVTFTIDVPANGTYLATVRYANGGADPRPLDLTVNDGAASSVNFVQTGSGDAGWNTWTDLEIEVELVAGTNTVKFEIPDGAVNGPNLDQITFEELSIDPIAAERFVDVVKINFEAPLSGNGSFNAPSGYTTPDGFESDTGEAYGARGNGFTYGWVDVDDTDGSVTGTPLAQPTGSARYKDNASEASDLQKTYIHFDYPGAAAGNRERAWEMEVENGVYELTVAVGDTAGQYDSNYVLNVEGVQFGESWIPVNLAGEQLVGGAYNASYDGEGFRSHLVTGIVEVTDGRLTIDGTDGDNVEIQWLDLQSVPDLTPDDGRSADLDYSKFVSAVAASTEDGQVSIEIDPSGDVPLDINPTSDIVVGIELQAIDHRGPAVAYTDGVRLVETLTGEEVAVNVQVTGGADSLTIRPMAGLKEFTSYTLIIEDVLDLGNLNDSSQPLRQFQDYTTTFVTGEMPETEAREVAFDDQVVLNGFSEGGVAITSIDIGPDGKLYASSISGTIQRWDLNPDGTIDLESAETLSLDYFQETGRTIIGLAFDPEDPNTIWVSDNATVPRQGRSDQIPEFSGQISKITLGEGGSFEGAEAETYLTGLPRSGGDHVTNSIEFRANPDAGQPGEPNYLLYFSQGSNSAAGRADNAWGNRPERLLNAAILEVDPTRDAPEGGFDVQTEPFEGTDPTYRTSEAFNEDGTFDGYYDPFEEGAVLKIYGEGIRNAYDLVWHSNGHLYVPTNGTARGGNTPDDPNTAINEELSGLDKQYDYFFTIEEGGYYGHPNPLLDNYVVNGGNPTSGSDPNSANTPDGGNEYAVGVQPDEDYDLEGAYSLGFNKSPNGATEYTGSAFGSNLQGAVLFAQFSQGDNVRVINVDPITGEITGDDVLRRVDGSEINEYIDPLDIIENPLTGQLYLSTLNRSTGESLIILLNPAPGGVVGDNTADENNDLQLVVINVDDPSNVVFEVVGLDDDIQSISVSFNGGAAQTVTLDGQNRFVADVGATSGSVSAMLTVEDDDNNTASDTIAVSLDGTSGPTFIDASEFTVLDTDDGTIIRILSDPSTHEDSSNDANGDGLNDGHDGDSYIDLVGGPEDKVSFTYVADAPGTYTLSFRLASATSRSIAVKTGDQSETINANTDSFTNWVDYPVVLTLEAGINTIVIAQTTAAGPNIDSVTVTPLSVEDITADEGGDLDLIATDLSDLSEAVFTISGADSDIVDYEVVFDDGSDTVTVNPTGNGSFTVDLTGLNGSATATLTVTDGANNTASETTTVSLTTTVPNDGTEEVGGATFVIYEAENAQLDGPVVEQEDRTQSGDFVDFDGTSDQSITWTVEVPQDGNYALDILYALSTTKEARPMALSVDGTVVETLPFAPNSNNAETEWGPQSTQVTLTAGVHTLTVTAPGANGPNVDYLRITQSPLTSALDLTADEGDNLALTVVDQTDSSAVVFEINGLDDDITTAQISFDGGAPISVTPQNGQFTLDPGISFGEIDAVLTVLDDAGNVATAETEFAVAPNGNVNADIAVQSLDAAYYADRLHFSFLQNPVNKDETRDYKDEGTVRISNTGSEDLEFASAALTGPFDLVDPTIFDNLVLSAGESIDVTVVFDNSEVSPKPTSGVNSVLEGELTLVTNDAEDPFVTVDLAAFWQSNPEGGQEPNVNEVWELFGFGNEIEGLSYNGGGENSVLNFFDLHIPVDETEVLSPYWKIADGATEAKITQIAAFHGPGGASLGIHGPGDKGNSNQINFGSHGGTANQTILPLQGNGNAFTRTFDNSDIPDGWAGPDYFGIEVAGLSTDPTLNPTGSGQATQAQLDAKYPGQGYTVSDGQVYDADGNEVSDGYTVRMYQAVDAEGNVIDNVFLGVMDYTGINYDYNDNMFIIEGVAPVFDGASLEVEGLDAAAADDRLVFTSIDQPVSGQEFRNEATITLSNAGFAALAISAITFDGADAGSFEIVGNAPTSIPAGGSVDVTIAFTGIDGVDDNAAVLQNASLTVETSAGDTTIALAGLAQLQSESGEEPTVAQIVEAFGYSTDVAQGQLNGGGDVETIGDEVLLPYLQRLDDSQPVEVINMAAFLQQGNISRVNIHDLSDDGLTELFAGDDQQGQTVSPDGLVVGSGNTGSVGQASLNRDAPFGIKVTVDGRPTYAAWTDPEINKADSALGVNDEGHYIRFFEAKDSSGAVIEGTYIGVQDYPGGGNFDYNDAMFVVTNVTAYDPSGAEDADSNGVIDALETDSDLDGTVDFFDDDSTPSTQAPFGGTAPVLADTLSVAADTFDTGGQGVAWNDSPGQAGGNGRGDSDVEIIDGAVAYVEGGEWVEYTIDVSSAGTFDLSTIAKAPTSGATISVSIEDGPTLATITLPDANDPGNNGFGGTDFGPTDPVEIDLEAGQQTLRFTFGGTVADNGYILDFQSFSLERVEDVVTPGEQSPFPGPDAATFSDGLLSLNAVEYDNGGQGVSYNDDPGLDGGTNGGRDGSDVEVTGAGDVGWIADGEWLEYTIDVPADGSYDAELLMSFGGSGGRSATLEFYKPDASTPYASSGPVANGSTGSWTTFETRDAGSIDLEAGEQVVRITFNGGSQDLRSFTLTQPVVEEPPAPEVIGEAGTVTFTQENSDQWFQIDFGEALENPSVVMGPLTFNGAQQSVVRVRNVTDTGFEFQLDEWDYLNGQHIEESVSWIAIEAGTHLVNGQTIIAGRSSVSGAQSDVDFSSDFDEAPVVVAQVTTTNDTAAVTERLQDITADGFSVVLDNQQSDTTPHADETLAWIAIEEGGSALDGFLVNSTGREVDENVSTVTFDDSFATDEFIFIADMQTEHGNDPSDLRLVSTDAQSAAFFVQEETSADDETLHTTEEVGYLAMLEGSIFHDIV